MEFSCNLIPTLLNSLLINAKFQSPIQVLRKKGTEPQSEHPVLPSSSASQAPLLPISQTRVPWVSPQVTPLPTPSQEKPPLPEPTKDVGSPPLAFSGVFDSAASKAKRLPQRGTQDLKPATNISSLFPHPEDLLFHNQVSDLQVSTSRPFCRDSMGLWGARRRGERQLSKRERAISLLKPGEQSSQTWYRAREKATK